MDPLINIHPLLHRTSIEVFLNSLQSPNKVPFFNESVSVQRGQINLHKVIMISVTDEGKELHTHRGREMKGGGTEGGGGVKSHKTVVNLKGGIVHSGLREHERQVTSDGLVASMAPLPANEVGQEHNEDKTC